MRRVLSLILVLAFCLSMACPVFAARHGDFFDSPGSLPSDPGGDDGGSTGGSGSSGSGGSWIPKTGDIIMMWVIIMVISLLALVAVVVIFRKKFHK